MDILSWSFPCGIRALPQQTQTVNDLFAHVVTRARVDGPQEPLEFAEAQELRQQVVEERLRKFRAPMNTNGFGCPESLSFGFDRQQLRCMQEVMSPNSRMSISRPIGTEAT